jgi:hypothetical protein
MKKKSPVLVVIIVAVVILSFLAIRYTTEASAISKLQVTVKDVQIQEIKVTYTKLKLNIEISNPTSEGISKLSTDFNIFIAGSIVGEGSMPLTDIPAQTVKETSTTIIIYYANVANAVIDALANQNFKLTIQGTLHTKVLFGLLSLSQDFSSTYSYS